MFRLTITHELQNESAFIGICNDVKSVRRDCPTYMFPVNNLLYPGETSGSQPLQLQEDNSCTFLVNLGEIYEPFRMNREFLSQFITTIIVIPCPINDAVTSFHLRMPLSVTVRFVFPEQLQSLILSAPNAIKTLHNESLCFTFIYTVFRFFPAGIYLLKVNNRNTRTRCEICSKLTIKTPERTFWCLYC